MPDPYRDSRPSPADLDSFLSEVEAICERYQLYFTSLEGIAALRVDPRACVERRRVRANFPVLDDDCDEANYAVVVYEDIPAVRLSIADIRSHTLDVPREYEY